MINASGVQHIVIYAEPSQWLGRNVLKYPRDINRHRRCQGPEPISGGSNSFGTRQLYTEAAEHYTYNSCDRAIIYGAGGSHGLTS